MDSKQQSQQASGRRRTPQTLRSPGSAETQHSTVISLYEYYSCIKNAWIFQFCPPMLIMAFAVAQLVQALRCKPEGRGFDWDFSSFRPHIGPRVDSASNKNEYKGYLLGVKATSV
jgi:hypothetical protein